MATAQKLTAAAKTNGNLDINEAKTDVAIQLEALKTDFAGLAAAVQSLTAAGTTAAKDTASAKISAASDVGEAAARQALDQVNEGAAAVTAYAREKPLMALAAAAGAGLLLGYLTAPRK